YTSSDSTTEEFERARNQDTKRRGWAGWSVVQGYKGSKDARVATEKRKLYFGAKGLRGNWTAPEGTVIERIPELQPEERAMTEAGGEREDYELPLFPCCWDNVITSGKTRCLLPVCASRR